MENLNNINPRPSGTLQQGERNKIPMELSKRYLAKSEENVRQAEAVRRKTARARTGLLPLLVITLLILAAWTAYVFLGMGAVLMMALLVSLMIHTGLASSIHTTFQTWGRGESGRAIGFGIISAVIIIALVGVACVRATRSIEDGADAFTAWLMTAVYSALEISLPILMGAEYAHRCERDDHAHEDLDAFKKLANDIREDMEDAPGIWHDHEASHEAQITELQHQDTGTAQERKKIERLVKRLRRLHESHPGKRFHELAGTKSSMEVQHDEMDTSEDVQPLNRANRLQSNGNRSASRINEISENAPY